MASSFSPPPPVAPFEPEKRIASRGKEPSRRKTHWDYVLEEMAWLAKDFESERKMKLSQAKKMAVKVCRSGLSSESKGQRRIKEEEQRMRRLASNIAKEVKKFWTKIEKLIIYKHQLELEGRRKIAMDKHLDFLVGQTERYSTMLAEIWLETPTADSQPSEDAQIKDCKAKQEFLHLEQPSRSLVITTASVEMRQMHAENVSDPNGLDMCSKEPNQKHISVAGERNYMAFEHSNSNGEDQPHLLLNKSNHSSLLVGGGTSSSISKKQVLHKNGPDKPHMRMGIKEEDGEFSIENTEDVEDDLSTLEADEALITEDERKEELLALEREGNLPLEELLKMYTSRRGEEDDEEDEEEEEDDDDDDDDDVEEEEQEGVEEAEIEDKEGGNDDEEEELVAEKTQVQTAVAHAGTDNVNVTKELAKDCSKYLKQEEPESVNSVRNVAGREKNAAYNIVDAAAAAAQSAQPTGFTFSTTKVRTKLPFLLKHSLREYQHIGLDWLVTMYERRLNGILADEMGLGKTIMTISLLAHLACDKGIWGPHLIVVPTSVMLNWETEFMKWCPAFKILTYFGTAKERKVKRQGWSKANYFHVCITTYRLVIQDAKAFKRKKWKYLILDEAHLIKNWKSQRWQTLLNFNSKRRILLTGTPLQNDLMELWSLMHFLMPHIFQSHQQFRDWFNNPITGMVEGQEQINKPLVDRLHNVLRPFILRRLKADVEKQLPKKYEHVVRCRLSKRQRNLYEDFMASSDTQATLSSGNFLGLLNVLMQLRKVCNHPDLFEGRPIISSFDMPGIDLHISSAVFSAMQRTPAMFDLRTWNLLLSQLEFEISAWEAQEIQKIATPSCLIEELGSSGEDGWDGQEKNVEMKSTQESILDEIQEALKEDRKERSRQRIAAFTWLNAMRCSRAPLYGSNFIKQVTIDHPVQAIHKILAKSSRSLEVASCLLDLVQLPSTRCEAMMDLLQTFIFAIPAARSPPVVAWCSHPVDSVMFTKPDTDQACMDSVSTSMSFLRPILVRSQLFFPDRKLIQFDCGKLQELALLLRRLRSEGHRALIFTQMTKMLDVLESFVNLHGYTYLRLDGSTKPEERQILMQRFNTNPKFFLFILSTRSGGVGVNLVGADTVIFYDSDWNPAMDQQAQDRCHRIGQTREVHIYRLISESTIEENILKKANQKRFLDDLVIQGGSYNTEFFKKLDPAELLSGLKGVKGGQNAPSESASEPVQGPMQEISNTEVEAALKIAEDEADYMALKKVEQEEAAENQEFTEEGYSGRMEEDDCADDLDDGKAVSEKGTQFQELPGVTSKTDLDDSSSGIGCKDLVAIDAALNEDMDMLADVKQIAAAAAAAGHGNVSFDNQLCPAERYAMRFLEMWDPIIDKDALQTQVEFEETEWEIDQLERLKMAQEAEIDEDNEPLVYESWDTSYADEAYRQQLEALTQQEYEHQLQLEKMEEEMQDTEREEMEAETRSKWKKAKFKSLKKGGFVLVDEAVVENEVEIPNEVEWQAPEGLFMSPPYRGPSQRKRKSFKLLEEEMHLELQAKKMRKDTGLMDDRFGLDGEHGGVGEGGSVVMLLDSSLLAPDNGKKSNGIPILGVPTNKGFWLKLDKERKKDGSKAGEKIPPADSWRSSEDAIFCAIVHEYGGNWLLASDTLSGFPDGGTYRGRYRHPAHCKERFRQLLLKYTSIASTRDLTGEKVGAHAASNAPLKVTEEHIKQLLEAVQELPDDEWLLQSHFVALLTSEGIHGKSSKGFQNNVVKLGSSPHGRSFIRLPRVPMGSLNLNECPRPGHKGAPSTELVAAALSQQEKEVTSQRKKEVSSQQEKEDLSQSEREAFLQQEKELLNDESGLDSNSVNSQASLDVLKESDKDLIVEVEFLSTETLYHSDFPNKVEITIPSSLSVGANHRMDSMLSKFVRRFSKTLIDQRYRLACRMSAEGESKDWAAAAGTGLGVVGGSSSVKGQVLGKRRLEPGKSSEKKKRHLSKGKEKNVAEETESHADVIDLNASAEFPKDNYKVDACDEVETSAAAALRNCSQTLPGTRTGSGYAALEDHLASNPEGGVVAEASEIDRNVIQNNGTLEASSGCQTRLLDALSSQGSVLLRLGENELTQAGCLPPEGRAQFLVGDIRRVTFRDPMYESAANYRDLPSLNKEGHSASSFIGGVSCGSEAHRSASPD